MRVRLHHPYFEHMLAAGAVDCRQADVTRCGGIAVWLRAAALAQGRGPEISGHCAPHAHAHAAEPGLGLTLNTEHAERYRVR
ncbi:enolase C-terminal domain-like protein [Streptomyces sp. NPDC013187]|uniref:enolase C-terminal domain-like protein n=1 Tax=Streptomyces sp. NPDC013187 TaxID=3364865 RepID=UPI00367FD89E